MTLGRKMTRTAILDGDIIAYRAAAANEKRTVKAVHKETAEESVFDTMTKFKEWCNDSDFDPEDFTVTPHQDSDELQYAFAMMKQMIENITTQAKCESFHICISGDDNFRLELPLPTRYKDSRKDSTRPIQLEDCKKYLVKFQGAEVSAGKEADDLLVEHMYQSYREHLKAGTVEDADVQCSLDKDAKHGAGWVFDWTTMQEPELITGFGQLDLIIKETAKMKADGTPQTNKSVKGKGRIWLYYQMVFGDPVDAYKPCELAKAKFGEIGAYDLLKNCTTDKEALEALVRQYKKWYPKPVTYRAWDDSLHTKDWMEIWQMYADCAFMRRFDGDRFVVKDVLDKLGVEYNGTER